MYFFQLALSNCRRPKEMARRKTDPRAEDTAYEVIYKGPGWTLGRGKESRKFFICTHGPNPVYTWFRKPKGKGGFYDSILFEVLNGTGAIRPFSRTGVIGFQVDGGRWIPNPF